jgi:hypothetical protein
MEASVGSKGRDNGFDQRGEVGLCGFGVGWDVQVAEGLGGDGADGNAQDLLWKTQPCRFK